MTRQVLFVQGGGARVHDDWDAKLVASLRRELGPGYDVRYPRMPREHEPDATAWKRSLRDELATLSDGAMLVGHSIGATILIHTIAESPPAIALGAIFLVAAPYVGEGGWPGDGWRPERDLAKKLPSTVPIHLFYGMADETVPASHADLYARAIPTARLTRLPGRDHQLGDDLSEIAAEIVAANGRALPHPRVTRTT